MQNNNSGIIPLFSVPVLVIKYPESLEKELKFIKSLRHTSKSPLATSMSEDSFILNNKELKNISNFITTSVNFFANDVLETEEKLRVTQSWTNISRFGQSHHTHSHPNSILSGVFFLEFAEKSSPICFRKPYKTFYDLKFRNFNAYNTALDPSSYYSINPSVGDLLIFPSWLDHWVDPSESETDRVSLSFNTFADKSIGSIENLTHVKFD